MPGEERAIDAGMTFASLQKYTKKSTFLQRLAPSPQKILFVKLCCIGDIVFTTPALRALRSAFPSAHLTFLAASWVKEIVRQLPSVDEIMLFDAPLWDGRIVKKTIATMGLVSRLRAARFDLLIVGHRNRFFPLLGYLAGIRTRIGFERGGGRLLTHAVSFRSEVYEARRYLDLLAPLGISWEDETPRLEISDDARRESVARLSAEGVEPGAMLVAVHAGGGENPGTRMTIKRWDLRRYVEVCTTLLEETPASILLIGGQGDKELNDEIVRSLPQQARRVRNLAGRVPLGSIPGLLGTCRLVVGGDTGPVHLAAAVGTPTLYLFGPSDPRLVAPHQPNVRWLWHRVACSPCYTPETVLQKKYFRGKEFICHTGTHECLEALTAREVAETIRSMLRGSAS